MTRRAFAKLTMKNNMSNSEMATNCHLDHSGSKKRRLDCRYQTKTTAYVSINIYITQLKLQKLFHPIMRCSGFSYQSLPRIPLPERWNQHLEIHGAPTMCHDEPPAIEHLADWRPRPAVGTRFLWKARGGSCLCLWTLSGNWGQEKN